MNRTRVRAIIEHDAEFLMVRNLSSQQFWCLPGGGVEPGEDIVSALRREIIEETGVAPQIGNLVFVHQFGSEGQFGLPEFFFHVRNGGDFVKIDITATSHGEAELAEIGFKDITELTVLPEFLKQELPRLAAEGFSGPAQVRVIDGSEVD